MHGLTCNVVKLFMEMDPKLFEEQTAIHTEDESKIPEKDEKKLLAWQAMETKASQNPLYEKVKDTIEPKASLAYAIRAQQLKDGGDMFDFASVATFDATGRPQAGSDNLRRKSTLPV